MNDEKLLGMLNKLWAAVIDKYTFDMLHNSIHFVLRTIDVSGETVYEVDFEKVCRHGILSRCGGEKIHNASA